MPTGNPKTLLTETLWNELRKQVQLLDGIPEWVSELCSLPFSGLNKLPLEHTGRGFAQPELRTLQKSVWLSWLKQSQHASSKLPDAVPDILRKIKALERMKGESVLALYMVKDDYRFYCYFDKTLGTPFYFEEFKVEFGERPRWHKELVSKQTISSFGFLLLLSYMSTSTARDACITLIVSIVTYLVLVWLLDYEHQTQALVTALIVALLAGLLLSTWARIVHK